MVAHIEAMGGERNPSGIPHGVLPVSVFSSPFERVDTLATVDQTQKGESVIPTSVEEIVLNGRVLAYPARLEIPILDRKFSFVSVSERTPELLEKTRSLLRGSYSMWGEAAGEVKAIELKPDVFNSVTIAVLDEQGDIAATLSGDAVSFNKNVEFPSGLNGSDLVLNVQDMMNEQLRQSEDKFKLGLEFGSLALNFEWVAKQRLNRPDRVKLRTDLCLGMSYMAIRWFEEVILDPVRGYNTSNAFVMAIMQGDVGNTFVTTGIPFKVIANESQIKLNPMHNAYFNETWPYWYGSDLSPEQVSTYNKESLKLPTKVILLGNSLESYKMQALQGLIGIEA